jgi:pimeloyl-ACP methyl ester carboxylesterase
LILVASLGLLTGCAGDGDDPLGPATRLDSPDPAPVFGAELSAHEGISIQFGDFGLHVPANVNHVRGILVALGGPNTRGFALGTPFGAPLPATEASLQELGAMFRNLAAERGLAILGSGRSGYPNNPATDQLLLEAIAQAATLTGRPDLLDAPLLLYGMSGGGPEAWGFTQRNPERVAALFLRVPPSAGPLTGQALRVPAYMVLAELDAFVNNTILTATFEAHRAAGAPWAMALEPGVPHHSLSPAQRDLTVDWMRAILPLGKAGPFRQNSPQVGWLGDPATGQIAPVRTFAGDRSAASWVPMRPLAAQWAAFIGW